jgi:hypothetical protein
MANQSEPHKILGGTSPREWPKQSDPLTDTEKQAVATGLLLFKDFVAQGRFDRDLVVQMLAIATKLGIRAEWDTAVKTLPSVVITER